MLRGFENCNRFWNEYNNWKKTKKQKEKILENNNNNNKKENMTVKKY